MPKRRTFSAEFKATVAEPRACLLHDPQWCLQNPEPPTRLIIIRHVVTTPMEDHFAVGRGPVGDMKNLDFHEDKEYDEKYINY